ncbi:hypothetical protein ABZ791_12670 [Streptomyces huasconensis]|uniref:Uncharacterized protein n=1 Tax=Streptomyces huasconensis TaxID=1854574 RepID=A0ABV3LQQ8_9ACTN
MRIRTATVATVAALAVAAPAGTAFADTSTGDSPAVSAVKKKPAQLTVKGYIKALKADKSPAAAKTLKAFKKLNDGKKQYAFVKLLQNRDVYEAVAGRTKGILKNGTRTSTKQLNAPVKVTSSTVVTKDDKSGRRVVTFTVTERIYDIPVTSERISVRYTLKGKKKIADPSASTRITNTNKAITIRAPKTTPVRVKGTSVSGHSTIKATGTVESFGKGVTKKADSRIGLSSYSASIVTR